MIERVLRGGAWGVSGQIIVQISSLFITPFVIRALGVDAYGLVILINLLIGYAAIGDLGMGTASTKFGAEEFAKGDRNSESSSIWTSLLISLIPTIIIAASFGIAAKYLVEGPISVPSNLRTDAVIALRVAAVGYVLKNVIGVINTPQVVRLKIGHITFINSGCAILQNILIAIGLFFARSILIVLLVTLLAIFINLVASIWLSMKLLPELSSPKINFKLIKELVRYGLGVIVSSVSLVVLVNGEKWMLARYASVSALAYYSVAFALASVLGTLSQALNQSLIPAFSRLSAVSDTEGIKSLYTNIIRWCLIVMTPIMMAGWLLARPFFSIWAGEVFGHESTKSFYILSFGFLLSTLPHVSFNLIMAIGKSQLVAKYQAIETVLYLVLTVVLISIWGGVGAALAWTLRIAADCLVFGFLARREAGVSFSVLDEDGAYFILGVIFLAFPIIMGNLFATSVIFEVLLFGIAFIFFCGLLWVKVLSSPEKIWVANLISVIRRSLFKEEVVSAG